MVGLICDVPDLLHILYENIRKKQRKFSFHMANHRLHILLTPVKQLWKKNTSRLEWVFIVVLPVRFLHIFIQFWIFIFALVRACVPAFECERKANVKNSAIEGSHQNHITSDSALSGLGQTKQNQIRPCVYLLMCVVVAVAVAASFWFS